MLSYVWSENAAFFVRLMEIHSNPPILYYGFYLDFTNLGEDASVLHDVLVGGEQDVELDGAQADGDGAAHLGRALVRDLDDARGPLVKLNVPVGKGAAAETR